MRVIYVHGVSERHTQVGYREQLARRRTLFDEVVADRLGETVTQFGDCPWGHLRPRIDVRATRTGKVTQSFGTEDVTDPSMQPVLRCEDFRIGDGTLDSAALFDAALMTTPDLTAAERKAVQRCVVHLAECRHRHPEPPPGTPAAQVILDIHKSLPEANSADQRFDGSNVGDWLVRVADYWSPHIRLNGMSLRDVIARELGMRWADAIWYVGGGRGKVQSAMIEGFDRQSIGTSPGEVIVVLGHSFGALVSFEAMNSAAFIERGLHRRANWVLLCLGAQLPIFRQLEIVDRERFRSELFGRAKLRNLIDLNDPLAFSLMDEGNNIRFLSGAGIVLSHTAYLDSPAALVRVREALRSVLDDWKRDADEARF